MLNYAFIVVHSGEHCDHVPLVIWLTLNLTTVLYGKTILLKFQNIYIYSDFRCPSFFCFFLYPQHLCRGVYSFRLSVGMFVRSYFRPIRGITSKFYIKATGVEYISPTTHQKAFIFGP